MMPTQPDLQPETPEAFDTLEGATVDSPGGGTGLSRWIDDPRLRKAANLIAATLAFYWVLEKLWPAPAGVVLKGMVIGGLYSLIALGLALIYRANRIINFAQADLGGVPASLAVLLIVSVGLPYVLAIATGLVAGIVLGVVVEFIVIRRFAKAPRLILTVATIGVSAVLSAGEVLLPTAFGVHSPPQNFPSPFNGAFRFHKMVFQGNDILAMLAVPLAIAGLAWFLNRTHMGIAVRACAESSDRASLLGVPVKRVNMVVWAVASLLATVALILRAGVIGLPIGSALGLELLLPTLAAAVIGRMEKMPTIVVAAVLFGVVEQSVVWHTGSGEMVDLVSFLVILAALLVQRRQLANRAEQAALSAWTALREVRPVPPELARLPEVMWARRALLGLVAVVAVSAPFVLGEARTVLACTLIVFMIVGLSLLVLSGWAGEISLGQFAFVGIGSATGAWMSLHWQIDIALEVVLAGLVGAAVAVAVGVPALRIRGLFLAVPTLAFSQACSSYFLKYTHFHWVPTQDQRLGRLPVFGRVAIDSEYRYYFFCLAVLILCIAAVQGLRRSRTARVLVALRENDRGVQAFGINVVRAKLTAFAFSGFLAAVAGVLLVHLQHALYPGGINPYSSLSAFVMVVIGGLGSMAGVFAGAIYLNGLSWSRTLFPQAVRPILEILGSGVGLVVVLMVLPSGVGSLLYRARDSLLRRLAERRGIVVPSLVADVRVTAEADEAIVTAPAIVEMATGSTVAPVEGPAAPLEPVTAAPEATAEVPVIDDALQPSPAPPVERAPRNPAGYLRWLSDQVGPAGLKPVVILLVLAAFERFGVTAIGILGPDIRDSFHISNQALIAVTALTSVFPALLSPGMGFLSDRVDRIRLAQAGTVCVVIGALGLALAPNFAVFAIVAVFAGIGLLVNVPTHSSLITDYYPPKALGIAFTFYLFATTTIDLGAGPISGGIGSLAGWRTAFVVLAIPTLIGVWLLGRIKDPGRGASIGMAYAKEERSSFSEGFRRVSAVRSLRRTWVAAFFFGGGVVAFLSLRNVFFKDVYHYGAATRGLTSVVFGLGALAGTIAGGRMVQRWMRDKGAEILPYITGIMVVEFGVGMILMGVVPWALGSVAMLFLVGFGFGGFNPAYNAMIGLVTTPRLRGQAYSYSLIFTTLGAIVVSPTIGGIANSHEREATWILGALMIMAGVINFSVRQFVNRDVADAVKVTEASKVDSLLTVRGLDVVYSGNIQILFGVDLDVKEGEIVALLGTNGAGKSTLLRAVSGLMDPVGGAVFFGGRDVTHADAVNKAMLGMALVPGDRGVFPGLSVGENLRIAGWMFRGDTAKVQEATERVLHYFPVLRERWKTQAGNLSGGEQQMLVLAQALMGNPKMLMIDELSLGLAPVIVDQLLDTVKQLADDGTTIVLVEQSVNVALTIAKRAVFMEKGEIRFSGPTAELLDRPDVLRAVFLEGAGKAMETAPARTNSRPTGPRQNGSSERAAALEVVEVSKRFGGVLANENVSLTLHEGEILGILGPNGAGKTTLFDLISGFFRVDSGRILLHGFDVTHLPADSRARLGLGRSFQDSKLFPALTVVDTVRVAFERQLEVRDPVAAALNLPAVTESEAKIGERVNELTEMLGLTAFRNKFVSELSTGTRRMVDLACILAHEPTVILFDEPSSGIAQRETEALGPLLRRIREITGSSLLVIEHDMPLLTSLADEIVALDLGRVVTRGAPDDVVHDPQVVASYLGTSTRAAARSGELAEALSLEPEVVGAGAPGPSAESPLTKKTRTPRGTK